MKLDPYWVTGFVDGEGTFYVGINSQPSMKTGFQVLPEFRIVQHERDIQLLYALKEFFNAGVVRVNHGDRYELRIRNLSVLKETVIPFFEKYPLHTKKSIDFIKFRKIILKMINQEHLTKEGIVRIIEIASQMNRADKPKAQEIKKDLQMDKDNVHACEKS